METRSWYRVQGQDGMVDGLAWAGGGRAGYMYLARMMEGGFGSWAGDDETK